jgi:signal peptidase I
MRFMDGPPGSTDTPTLPIPVTVVNAPVSEVQDEEEGVNRRGVVTSAVGIAIVGAAILRGLARRFAIRESSMSPTLDDGDWVIARRRPSAGLDRGDIVVFPDPSVSGSNLVKRVIGLPGERVGIEGGRVTINGALLADRWASGTTTPDGMWEVPDGHVWLLGDNRASSSSDGRVLGPLPIKDIPWVVAARYWPTGRAGLVG